MPGTVLNKIRISCHRNVNYRVFENPGINLFFITVHLVDERKDSRKKDNLTCLMNKLKLVSTETASCPKMTSSVTGIASFIFENGNPIFVEHVRKF